MRFDWFGFIALAVGIGSLQLMLDRGEQLGWFESNEIIGEMLVSIAGFYYFFAHSLTTQTPFMRFEMFKDRNFVSACLFMVVIGVVLFGTMALMTPFMQNVMGYPILTAGILLAARGIGTLISMMLVGRLMKLIEARWLVLLGLAFAAYTLYEMAGFTNDTTAWTIVTTGMLQGFGVGFVFVPLSTVAFTSLPGHLRTEGSAILTLVRNIGSSIGISAVIAQLTQKSTMMHARLVEGVTPFNDALAQAKADARYGDRHGPRHARRHRDAAGDDPRLRQHIPAADLGVRRSVAVRADNRLIARRAEAARAGGRRSPRDGMMPLPSP